MLAYVGNRGVNNQSDYNMNASMIPGSGNNGRPLFQQFRRVADTTISIGTNTWYNSLQLKLDRRVGDGFFLTTAYTFSKGLNYSEDNGGVAIPMNVALNKAHMQDNRTHLFTQSYMYDLPVRTRQEVGAERCRDVAPGRLAVSGSAQPQYRTVVLADGGIHAQRARQRDSAELGDARRVSWRHRSRAEVLRSPARLPFRRRTRSATPAGTSFRGRASSNLDAALHRQFRIREGMELALRVESFNFSNTPHYNNPNFNINSPQFGEINGADAGSAAVSDRTDAAVLTKSERR